MKTVSIKTIMSVFALASTISFANASTVNEKHVYNNDKVEDGKIVVREVCSEENGLLTLVNRSEMEYTDNGRLAARRDFKWNSATSSWDLVRSLVYTYGENSFIITLTDAKGNTKSLEQSY